MLSRVFLSNLAINCRHIGHFRKNYNSTIKSTIYYLKDKMKEIEVWNVSKCYFKIVKERNSALKMYPFVLVYRGRFVVSTGIKWRAAAPLVRVRRRRELQATLNVFAALGSRH